MIRIKLISLLCLIVPYPKNMVAYRMADMSQSHCLEHVHVFSVKDNLYYRRFAKRSHTIWRTCSTFFIVFDIQRTVHRDIFL